jgi:hypothetical protein
MTPETTTVVVYLLTFILGGVPTGTPFSVVSIPNLPSLEECQYLARELMSGIPEPKFRCLRYQTATVTAAPSESVAAVPLPKPRTWKEHRTDEDDATPVAPWGLDPDPEACAAGARECPTPPPVQHGVSIPQPHTAIEREFGTLFGTMPRDGRAAPLNELVIATRSTSFRILIWPDVVRRFNAKMKEQIGRHIRPIRASFFSLHLYSRPTSERSVSIGGMSVPATTTSRSSAERHSLRRGIVMTTG